VLFNNVRRMTDTHLNIFPQAKVRFRAGYSQYVIEGPSLNPSASPNLFDESIGATDQLLEQYQRDSTDDPFGAMDWKPAAETQRTYEEQGRTTRAIHSSRFAAEPHCPGARLHARDDRQLGQPDAP